MFSQWFLLATYVLSAEPLAAHAIEFKEQIVGDSIPGWQVRNGPAESWSVRDGVLHCHVVDHWGSWIGTVREYTDFIIELEYRLGAGGNTGVYLRTPETGHPSTVACEIQILDNTAEEHKNLQPAQFCGSIYKIAAATRDVTRPAGQWNRMRIMADADHIVVWINGKKVVDATGGSNPDILARSRQGAIGLQNHRTEVAFRNIRIANLAEYRGPSTQ